MFSSTQPVSLGYLPDHLASHAARSRRASGRSRRSYSQRSSCRQSSSTRARYVVERVPQEVHVTALIGRLRQNLAPRCPEAGGAFRGEDPVMAARSKPMVFRGCAPLAFRLTVADPNYQRSIWSSRTTRSWPSVSLL